MCAPTTPCPWGRTARICTCSARIRAGASSRCTDCMRSLIVDAPAVSALEDPAWRVPVSHEFTVRDFRFHTGEVLPALRLAYTVLGRPNGKPVLALHGTGRQGRDLLSQEFGGRLFSSGGPLDAAEHFLVLPDAIGRDCLGHSRSAMALRHTWRSTDRSARPLPRATQSARDAARYRIA